MKAAVPFLPMQSAELEALFRDFALSTYTAQMNGVRNLAPDDSFTEHQLFDSLTLMSFIAYIERLCSISIPVEDIVPGNFDSICCVLDYLRARDRVA